MTLADLRHHLASCFEPEFRIIGNTTCREIVEAIDAAEQERTELKAEVDTLERKLNDAFADNEELAGILCDMEGA